MEIKQFVWDVVDSNSWLLVENNQGLLIDVVDSDDLLGTIVDLESLKIILTHSHFDHIIGLNRLRELRHDATVIATNLCSENLGNIHKNMSSTADAFMTFYHEGASKDYKIVPFSCGEAGITFEGEYGFEWYWRRINLKAVHGHSADGLIVVVDEKLLFSGDTLLSIPTVTRFPSGSSERFWLEDIPMLQAIKNIELVFPGHGKPGKLDELLKINRMPERYRKR